MLFSSCAGRSTKATISRNFTVEWCWSTMPISATPRQPSQLPSSGRWPPGVRYHCRWVATRVYRLKKRACNCTPSKIQTNSNSHEVIKGFSCRQLDSATYRADVSVGCSNRPLWNVSTPWRVAALCKCFFFFLLSYTLLFTCVMHLRRV